jgi:predicted RNA binding protein YcfA (HicA-like mRNA interferase family)
MPKISPVSWKVLEKVFLAAGFKFARQEGSHRSYVKPGVARPVVVPTYDDVPVTIIRNNLRSAGITREEYFRLLRKK